MMKLSLLALTLGAAAAFAPSSTQRTSSALSATFEDQPGVLAPVGYFDPFRLATTQDNFDKYRAAELKHGRVAMLAVVGYVVPEFYRFGYDFIPGELNTNDITNGIAALKDVPFLGWVQIFTLVGAVDLEGVFGDFEVGKPTFDEEVLLKRQTQELQNGRLAMLATLELLRHDCQNSVTPGFDGLDNLITGLPFLYN